MGRAFRAVCLRRPDKPLVNAIRSCQTLRREVSNPMAIVFYYAPYSSAVRCHWALEELGIRYEGVKIDLKGTDHKTPEFLKLNPNGSVPTLVDDGVPYFESAAINLHLGQKYGVEKGLWPAAGSA